VAPLSRTAAERILVELSGWMLAKNGKSIEKDIVFKDFAKAMDFVNIVADIAELEGHHPDMGINYNKVHLVLTTHAIGGLSQNDFVLAAKIDSIRI
jgi:4a-hydroxytetrahydrobiopterin dehydratase